jgi:hypothetical protein
MPARRLSDRPDILAAVLTFDRWCSEIVARADTPATTLVGADLTTPVPTCPGWDVGPPAVLGPWLSESAVEPQVEPGRVHLTRDGLPAHRAPR